MNEKFQEKIIEYIDALAAKLGVAAEHVYGVLVRQQVVEGIVYTVVTAILLLTSIAMCKELVKQILNSEDFSGKEIIFGFALILTGVIVVATVTFLPDQILKIYNPEYYAIKTILDAIGGK